MKHFIKAATIASSLALAAAFSATAITPAAAAFDICKKVKITVVNKTGGPIKLFDLDYWDFGSNRKRSENISNRVIPNGGTYKTKRNLEGVNNAKTYITVQFRKLKSNGKWNNSQYWEANSSTSVCSRGKKYRIVFR